MSEQIGFVGTGLMGSGMAKNLLQAGHALSVLAHRNRKPIEHLMALGAIEVADLKSLATGAKVLFLCLPNANIVEQVIGGLFPHLQKETLIIDTTTSLPETSQVLNERLAKIDVEFIDAPVTGGPPAAANGTLTTMLGGSSDVCERATPLIRHYSTTVVRFGDSGSGNRAKLIHNFITMGHVALIVEAFRRCDHCGIDREAMYEVMSNGGADSATLRKMVPSALYGTYDGHAFSLANAAKDVDYIAHMAANMGEESRLIPALQAFFAQETATRPGNLFVSELLRPSE
ncbi:MAG: NAD(P)-dependent oxidoreductase [Candidatus Competibacteraceae bacterium]|jgi:3-hydroxyisobutyrate dehydrogenase-like beta-hydroxyacid dehydrogenase|nr:NAD(P)-dependent oxidoreductase [Candidatus Competibacteraceae bacterium]